MRDSERETICAIGRVASREHRGRLQLTPDQCKDLARVYEADPLYAIHSISPELRIAVMRYGNRKRNVPMNALCITYLYRAVDGMVVLHVGRRMAFSLLSMLDADIKDRALRLAGKWRRERERREFG